MSEDEKDVTDEIKKLKERLERIEQNTIQGFKKLETNEFMHVNIRIDSLQSHFDNKFQDVQKQINERFDKVYYCIIGAILIPLVAIIILKMCGWF